MPHERAAALAAARRVLAHEALPAIDVDAIALFVQDHDGAEFRLAERHGLDIGPSRAGAEAGTAPA